MNIYIFKKTNMFTCLHCTFRHPFEWSLKEHMYVKHNDSSNLNINSTILSPPTKIYAGQNGVNIPTTVSIPPIKIPTTVSIPPIRRKGRQSGMGVEYEDTDSEHGDTDEETIYDSDHEEHNHSDDENIGNDNEDTEEDTDIDVDNDNKFHLLHIINDTRSIFEYCIKMRKEYRKALKQFNNLNEEDTRSVIKSYAKLEVIVKDDQFGIENDNTNSNNNNEDNDDFWDFVYELRDKVEEDSKMLNNYVEVEKEIILSKKDIEEDVPREELNDIVENVINIKNGFHKHGEDCFETCSNAQIHSVGGLIGYANDPETASKMRNYNPEKYDLIRKLTESNNKSLRKIGDPEVTVHEKRKTLQKTNVGESVFKIIKDLILPYMANMK